MENLIETINNTNLENLMEIKCGHSDTFKTETAEEHNQLARRYNSNLRHTYDCLVPLHNKRNKCVFGFPKTLGELVSIDVIAEELLCGALSSGDLEPKGDFTFAVFCGCNLDLVGTFPCFGPTADQIAYNRMLSRHQRALDLAAANPPTVHTRQYAEELNKIVRKYNEATGYTEIKPLFDERGLAVPGFPSDLEWFSRIPKQDVLWLLGEYGLDMAEEGCLERFKDFVGVRERVEREGEVEWFL